MSGMRRILLQLLHCVWRHGRCFAHLHPGSAKHENGSVKPAPVGVIQYRGMGPLDANGGIIGTGQDRERFSSTPLHKPKTAGAGG